MIDSELIFSKDQAITSDAASTNIIKFGTREPAVGTPIELHIRVTEAFATLTSLTIKVQTATDAAFTTPVDLAEQTIAVANLTKNAVSTINFLPKGNKGYVRLYYDVTGSNATAGKITAYLTDAVGYSHHDI